MTVQSFTPYVTEETPRGKESMDVYTRLLKDRIIFLGDEVRRDNSNAVIAQLLFLQMSDSKKPVHLYINTPGGEVNSGMGIYDTMQLLIKKGIPVHTYCVGMAASMGSILLCGGSKGCRYSLPHSQVMIHQPLGGARGQTSDILIAAHNLELWRKKLTSILAEKSGQTFDKVLQDCDRDRYMTAEEAKEYGLIDHIL